MGLINCSRIKKVIITAPTSTYAWWLAYLMPKGSPIYYFNCHDKCKCSHLTNKDYFPPQWLPLRVNHKGEVCYLLSLETCPDVEANKKQPKPSVENTEYRKTDFTMKKSGLSRASRSRSKPKWPEKHIWFKNKERWEVIYIWYNRSQWKESD